MITADDARAIALALPGAVESSHFDHADFRIGEKIFASFPEPDRVTVRLEPEHARALMEADPETYIPHPGVWGDRGWIRVMLARIDRETLADLIFDSWYRLAPKRLRDGVDSPDR
jgi:hypothetical protein